MGVKIYSLSSPIDTENVRYVGKTKKKLWHTKENIVLNLERKGEL